MRVYTMGAALLLTITPLPAQNTRPDARGERRFSVSGADTVGVP
jgi:hypothetical protein